MTIIPYDVCERLRTDLGLDAGTLGDGALRAAWKRRIEESGAESEAEYKRLLMRSQNEFEAFAEELLVPESWFFRDKVPFEFLAKWAREFASRDAARVLRVLCVPCAAGQEAYSIAMTLLDAGLPPGRFEVLAGDISERSLEKARAGMYPTTAFRGCKPQDHAHHFESAGKGLRCVTENARNAVTFVRCNLVDPEFLRGEQLFDCVFCRNVLIYFDATGRRRAIANLRKCLAPGGLLFSGHADHLPMLDPGFAIAGPPGAFVWELKKTFMPSPVRRTGRTRNPLRNSVHGSTRAQVSISTDVPALSVTDPLEEARRKADAGKFPEAEMLCQDFLKSRGPNPGAFFLLGQLASARGKRAEAENFYRKTLYLDGSHHDALLQMALLTERRGDSAGAARLRQRVKA